MIDVQNLLLNKETNDLVVEVFRLNGALLATADKLVSKFGLTGARWQVLGAIVKAGQPETVSELAREMGLARQSVQRVVNDMVGEGMLALADNPQHQRARQVVMTKKGEKAFVAALELQGPWVKALSEGISKRRLVETREVLAMLRARLESQ